MGVCGGSTYSTGPNSTYISRGVELVDRVLFCRSVSHGRSGWMENIVNLSLDRKESLTMIHCSERNSTGIVLCTLLGAVLWGVYWVSPPPNLGLRF